MKAHRLPASKCPVCGYKMDAASGINNRSQPVAGDISLCFGCGEVLIFTEDLRMRQPDPMELLRYQLGTNWPGVERAQRMIRGRHASRRNPSTPG